MRTALLVLLGVVIGAWGSLCGIGGGIFAVPVFHYWFGLPLPRAVASSLVLVGVMTSGGTLGEFLRADSALRWDVVLGLLVTSILGTRVGFVIARRVSTRGLKRTFCVLLVLVASGILLTAGQRTSAPASAIDWTFGRIAYILAVGFVSGMLSPLLGIGGGLIAVPALLLGFPPLGYLGARAASTAMSAVNGLQSVWLYHAERAIVWSIALPAAIGALGGAFLGVALAHEPRVKSVAEVLVALTLYFVAARFAWDSWRETGDVKAST